MEMIAGIDLGTSSLKVILCSRQGQVVGKVSQSYDSGSAGEGCVNPTAWWQALKSAFDMLAETVDLKEITAIGLDAQVGTYILYPWEEEESSPTTVSWRSGEAEEQLIRLKQRFSKEYFEEHISMPHPDLVSYPAPRILWFEDEMGDDFAKIHKLLQPKDYLYYRLTGIFASDPYSWRGLANLTDSSFHPVLLQDLGISEEKLPALHKPTDSPGVLQAEASEFLGLSKNIPVFLGCNDFFASLLGMGILEPGQCFDMTGTSEHIGLITARQVESTRMVCGSYIKHHIHYGVTANSGTSMSWAFENFSPGRDLKAELEEVYHHLNEAAPPVFLPYLQGERAPVWDPRARGVFFGIERSHLTKHLAYAVMEGVVFSLYHIWSELQMPEPAAIHVAGGASGDDGLNRLKADLFQIPFRVVREKDSAALGAAMMAGVGMNWFDNIGEAIRAWVKFDRVIEPDSRFAGVLRKRFEIYRGLYPALQNSFKKWDDYRKEIRS